MERKKRSKGRGWESCYVKTIYGTFGVEMRAYGQKLVQFCTHTHTRVSFSSIDYKLRFKFKLNTNSKLYINIYIIIYNIIYIFIYILLCYRKIIINMYTKKYIVNYSKQL